MVLFSRFVCALTFTILALSLPACDRGGRSSFPRDHAARTMSISGASLISVSQEVAALPAPAGVSGALFARLKQAFALELARRGPVRFTAKVPVGADNLVDDLMIYANGDGTYNLRWSYRNLGDYDQSGEVGVSDITPVAIHFGHAEDAIYHLFPDPLDVAVDGDKSGEIGVSDITPIALNYLTNIAYFSIETSYFNAGPYAESATIPVSAGTGSGRKLLSYLMPVDSWSRNFARVVPVSAQGEQGDPSAPVPLPRPTNVPPSAALAASPTSGQSALTVNFDASASTDGDGVIAHFRWDFDGSGSWDADTAAVPATSHIYPVPGTYTARVGVVDDRGGFDSATIIIGVGGNVDAPQTFDVLVINFDPIIEAQGSQPLHVVCGWNDPHALADGYIADLSAASHGWANYAIADWIDADVFPQKADGFSYDDAGYITIFNNGWAGAHAPDAVDYYRIIADYNIAARVGSGEIDEVFIFGAPYFGFYESQMVGPTAYTCNSPPINDIAVSRNFVVMGFSYERGVGEMLEDYGHRAESIMTHVYGSWNGFPPRHDWDRFTLYDKIAPGEAACGNVHFAPNSAADYDWGNATPVASTCADWLDNFPNLTGQKTVVDASEWGGGDIRLHHIWWLTHFPHVPGISPGGKESNWWKYLADFNAYPESS